jgi:hypothetical protein
VPEGRGVLVTGVAGDLAGQLVTCLEADSDIEYVARLDGDIWCAWEASRLRPGLTASREPVLGAEL